MNTPTNTAEYIFIFFDEEIHLFCTSAGLQYSILIYELLFQMRLYLQVDTFHSCVKTPLLKDARHNLLEVINGVCLGTVVSLALKESCFTRKCLKLDNGL